MADLIVGHVQDVEEIVDEGIEGSMEPVRGGVHELQVHVSFEESIKIPGLVFSKVEVG